MTSLIIPRMKKTITDMMDDELYEAPKSPIQAPSARSDSPNPYIKRTQSNNGSINQTSSGNNLSSLLNIPDTFIDQYNRLSSGHNGGAVGANGGMGDEYAIPTHSNTEDIYSGSNEVNPFTDYGNPDSLSTQQQNHSFIQPQDITRRRRITTLSDEPMASHKPPKDDDYYLFNPDIQPSQLITNKNFLNEGYLYSDSMFIPNQTNDAAGISMGDYENHFMDDFDEDVEEELSDDEDDDNYFYDDFDDSTNNIQNEYLGNITAATTPKQDMTGGYIDDFGVNDLPEQDDDDMMIDDVNVEPPSDQIVDPLIDYPTEHSIGRLVEPSEDASPDVSLDSFAYPSPSHSPLSHDIHKTAAEISADNPNHQCDLINPSTGQPCNKQFSRPYDLIRHQETIHATKKKIFRCVICEGRLNGGVGNGKLKTFSRGDALSRHIKVKHGLLGKDALDLINEAKENVEYIYV